MLSQHIHKKYEINWGKKKVVYQPGTKLATPDFKRDLPDWFGSKLKFCFTSTLVKDESDSIWNNYIADIEKSGKKVKDVIKDEKKTRKEYDNIAQRRVRLGLFFNKIAEDESITVSDDEVNKALFEQARKLENVNYLGYRPNDFILEKLDLQTFYRKFLLHFFL